MIKVTWSQLKQAIAENSLAYAWTQDDNSYTVSAFNGPLEFQAMVAMGTADQVDFENNYKAGGNTPLVSVVSLTPTIPKFSFGQVSTAALTQVPVASTTYTETTTNSAMTIVSSNANDNGSGTGAQTVTVTYLDQTGAGPYTTTFTMNGTTPVSASVNNMCFVEKMIISTVGSGGSNAGTITLAVGGGATVGTIATGTNRIFWAHHYVASGDTCYISGLSIGNNAPSIGANSIVVLKVATPMTPGTPELQVSDFVNVSGGSNNVTRVYGSPIQVVGPARVRAYVTPGATSLYTTYVSFDYLDN